MPSSGLRTPLRSPVLTGLCVAAVAAIFVDAQTLVTGDPRCPCASPTALGSVALQLPSGFGINCANHFASPSAANISSAAPCQSSSKPSWCSNKWCFVDPSNCSLPVTVMTSPSLHYSFQTCGFLDVQALEVQSQSLAGQLVKVAYLNNSAGFSGAYYFGSWGGATFTYWQQVLAQTKASVQVALELRQSPWPNMSLPYPPQVMQPFRTDFPSSRSIFDSCVYATGMGFVDLCVGAFTINDKRVRVTRMISHYQVDVHLVAKQTLPPAPTTRDIIDAAWSPFSSRLWVVVFAVVIVSALLIALHERLGEPEPLRLRQTETYKGGITSLSFHVYNSWQGHWGGGLAPIAPSSPGARITAMGMSVFTLMVVAAYTANQLAFLVQKQTATGTISSLQDILNNPSLQVCCESQLAAAFNSKLGIPQGQIVPLPSRGAVLSALSAGDTCDAGGVYLEDLLQMHSQSLYCDYQSVQFLLTVGQGVAVSEKVARTLEVTHKALDTKGTWDSLFQAASAGYTDTCPPAVVSAASGTSLGPEAMLGSLVASCAFFLASMPLSLVAYLQRSKRCTCINLLSESEPEGPAETVVVEVSTGPSDQAAALRSRLDKLEKLLDGKKWT